MPAPTTTTETILRSATTVFSPAADLGFRAGEAAAQNPQFQQAAAQIGSAAISAASLLIPGAQNGAVSLERLFKALNYPTTTLPLKDLPK